MLRARLATAAVAIPLLLLLIFVAPDRVFAAVVGVIALAGVVEFATMAFPTQLRERVAAIAFGVPVVVLGPLGPGVWLGAALSMVVTAGLVWTLLARRDFERGLVDLGTSLVGVLYAGLLLVHFVWLRRLDDGPRLVVFVLAVVMAGDSGGYFVGHWLGRQKLMPRVSPGKTVEGAIGIMAAGVAAGAVIRMALLPWLGWLETMLLACLIGVLGQLGDLSESIMKRTFGVKESGWIIPGHGGVLDRVDSLLFPITFVYYYFELVR